MNKLDNLRKQIDECDTQLLQILSKRLHIVAEVGTLKKSLNIPPLDPTRWALVLENRLKKGYELGLRGEFVKSILDTIHKEALQIEEKI